MKMRYGLVIIIRPYRIFDKRDDLLYHENIPCLGILEEKEMNINEKKIVYETRPTCACKLKVRDKESKEYKDLLSRLNRIEGQVRGIKNMMEEDRYCVDILTQVSAITSALNSFNKKLLAQHIKSCVVHDIREGKDEVVDELCLTLQKLMK